MSTYSPAITTLAKPWLVVSRANDAVPRSPLRPFVVCEFLELLQEKWHAFTQNHAEVYETQKRQSQS